MANAQHYYSVRKCKSKLQWYTTMHPWGCLESKLWTVTSVSEDLEHGKNGKCISTLQNSLVFPQKISTDLPYGLAIPLLDICPRERETYIYTRIYAWVLIAALFVML